MGVQRYTLTFFISSMHSKFPSGTTRSGDEWLEALGYLRIFVALGASRAVMEDGKDQWIQQDLANRHSGTIPPSPACRRALATVIFALKKK